jgi:hypothetical protein
MHHDTLQRSTTRSNTTVVATGSGALEGFAAATAQTGPASCRRSREPAAQSSASLQACAAPHSTAGAALLQRTRLVRTRRSTQRRSVKGCNAVSRYSRSARTAHAPRTNRARTAQAPHTLSWCAHPPTGVAVAAGSVAIAAPRSTRPCRVWSQQQCGCNNVAAATAVRLQQRCGCNSSAVATAVW